MALMLKNVEFKIDNKIIRRGKIKVFNTKQFFIKFSLENSEIVKEYELPYPYKVISNTNGFIFDYCLSAFYPKTEEVYWRMLTMDRSGASKIHNNYLHINTLLS